VGHALVKPRRPYLLRAMHEWISDNGWTPHLVVDAGFKGVEVPRQFVQDGKIVLNVSWSATDRLQLGNEEVTFGARFGGSPMQVRVPVAAVLALYARETQQGMIFADEELRLQRVPSNPSAVGRRDGQGTAQAAEGGQVGQCTAQYLNSGILPTGSRAAFVRRLAAASA
jgi:stringent starvation protein B